MYMDAINWLAIPVAALVGFVVGFPWYGAMFGKQWLESVGMTEADTKNVNMGRVFGICFVLQLVMAFFLAMFLSSPAIGLVDGVLYGFLVGLAWIAPAMAINAMFEQKPFRYMAINGGYWVVVFTGMGAVLGAWR